jgi:hypothetical protein
MPSRSIHALISTAPAQRRRVMAVVKHRVVRNQGRAAAAHMAVRVGERVMNSPTTALSVNRRSRPPTGSKSGARSTAKSRTAVSTLVGPLANNCTVIHASVRRCSRLQIRASSGSSVAEAILGMAMQVHRAISRSLESRVFLGEGTTQGGA